MRTLLTIAALAAGVAFLPSTARADSWHGNHGSHHGGHGNHGGWGGHHDHGHNHHHHGHWNYYRPNPYYRIQPYPYYGSYPYYSRGFSVATPNVWIQSGW